MSAIETGTTRGPHPGLKYEYRLPHWADKNLHGEVELYAQLSTRDGRRTGNGIVVEVIEETIEEVPFTWYCILTDFGNYITVSPEQLERQFYPAEFRMNKNLVDFRVGAMRAYLQIESELACATSE
jgi:hypothetical protein